MYFFSLSSTPIPINRRFTRLCIRTSDIAPDWRRSRNERATERTERTRGSATSARARVRVRAMRYVAALVKLARRQACFLHFLLAWPKEDEHSELLNYQRARSHNAVRVLYVTRSYILPPPLPSLRCAPKGQNHELAILSLLSASSVRARIRLQLLSVITSLLPRKTDVHRVYYISRLLLEDHVKLHRIVSADRNKVTFLYSIYGTRIFIGTVFANFYRSSWKFYCRV